MDTSELENSNPDVNAYWPKGLEDVSFICGIPGPENVFTGEIIQLSVFLTPKAVIIVDIRDPLYPGIVTQLQVVIRSDKKIDGYIVSLSPDNSAQIPNGEIYDIVNRSVWPRLLQEGIVAEAIKNIAALN